MRRNHATKVSPKKITRTTTMITYKRSTKPTAPSILRITMLNTTKPMFQSKRLPVVATEALKRIVAPTPEREARSKKISRRLRHKLLKPQQLLRLLRK